MSNILNTNKNYSDTLKEKLGLNLEVVAIKFTNKVPEGLNKIDEVVRHCKMVKDAALGKQFYSTKDEQACKGGSATIGLEDFPEKLVSGETYFKLGRFKDIETSKKTIDGVPKIKENHKYIIYSPLSKADFTPDVIVIISEPKIGMKIAQSIVYSTGKRVNASFAGIQSLCGDIVAGPYNTSETNFSLGCDGSRKFAPLEDEELSIGINYNNIEEIVNNLKSF